MADFADTSGIRNALPSVQPFNPLQTATSVQSLQNEQMRNRLMQQQLLNEQQNLQNLQLQNQKGQTDLGQTQRVNAFTSLISLNRLDDPSMLKEAPAVLSQLRSSHNIPDEVASQIQSDIDSGNAGALRTHISNGLSVLNPDLRTSVTGQSVETTAPGGMTQYRLIPGALSAPGTQAAPLGQPVGGGLSPAQATQVQTIELPSGGKKQVTTGDIAGGKVPELGQATPNDQQKTAAVNSQNNATNAIGRVTSAAWNDQQQSLNSILSLTPKALAGKGTGPISDLISVASNVIPGIHPGVDSVASNTALLAKSLERVALNAGGDQGATDAKMFAQIAANPNLGMPPEAIQHAARYVLALNLQEKTLIQEAAKKATYMPLDPKTFYEQQRLATQNGLDQNAFLHLYQPDGGKYYAGLDKGGKARYDNTVKLIEQYAQPAAGMQPAGQ